MVFNQYGQPVGTPVANWQPCRLPHYANMQGRFCQLVPLDPARHYEALFAAYQQAPDGSDWTYLSIERPETPAVLLSHLSKLAADTSLINWTVIDLQTEQPVGTVAYLRIEPQDGTIEIGHVCWSPLMKRRSTATEAIYLLLRSAFEYGYRRCEWKCDSLNIPSKQAATRFNFHYEGCFRNARVYKGRTRDTYWFSIIDSHWPAIQQNFEQWLAADNFDANGQQKQRLQTVLAADDCAP